ncbi:dynein regulatory complex subunit 6-like isoform X1 [Daphnia pulicaria]|uniref:dynein regulatory complex subunit 6-like isoform X1 n=1 Tax=Daphnia pulicaria TaxID=35523 RepID=UPI001EEABC13|nr:dynein regulatory complex subunit 6-like isoform X1 [Daphnia pulicaria]
MPRTKSPKTLLELSIAHVVQRMDKWSWKPIKLSYTISDSELGTSPLHQLPILVLEEIMYYLHYNDLLGNHLKWVISSQLTELLLTSCNEVQIRGYLKHAAIQCPGMKSMEFQRCRDNILDIDTSILQCFPKFQQLEKLEIAYTSVGDNSLEVFGTYCKYLRELDVSHCPAVTDAGIQRLCGDAHHLGEESGRIDYMWDNGKCKCIQILLVKGTSVTKKGIQIALQNLPSLRVLRHELVLEVLSDMHQLAFESNNLPLISKYSLIEIAVASPYTHGSLGLALLLCPSIVNVKIKGISGFLNSDLFELLSVASLCHLHISACPEVTFYDGVIPLLKAHGNLLESLKLKTFNDVDFHSISELCPNLNSLSIDNCVCCEIPVGEQDSSVRWKRIQVERPILKNLEVLRLIYSSLNPESLLLLLSSPSLRGLEITGCFELTDGILETDALLHDFQNLEELLVAFCDSLTKKGIDLLMSDKNSIKEMTLLFNHTHSELLTAENMNEWKDKSKQKNWELKLDFLCY